MVALTSYPRVGLSSDDRSAGRYLCPRYRRCQWHRRCLRSTYGARWRAIVVGGRTYYSQTFFEKKEGRLSHRKSCAGKGKVVLAPLKSEGKKLRPNFRCGKIGPGKSRDVLRPRKSLVKIGESSRTTRFAS